MRIGLIGAGNLGKCMIDALTDNKITPLVSDAVEGEYKGIAIKSDNKSVIENSDIVILCVKPQVMAAVLEEIKGSLDGKLTITFAAGLPLEFYESRAEARFVRVMTNMALKYSQGVNIFIAGKNCTEEDKKAAEKVLKCFGYVAEAGDESLIDTVTGVSGSAIAYFIKIIDVFVKSAQKYDLSEEEAKKIVYETVKGAVKLMESGEPADSIISKIASKGGTTEQGLREMDEKGLSDILESTVEKTIGKCRSLAGKK
ncbi:TPA: pyrroline-5-carboxylate reductase [Candidatus Woesearchaeota archaeon]|nr:pyrroline-5-carboxylate reductase [Candidatus Woesearchaeota archaeon]HIH41958.1 pyrroline-5-carboxylate reductase [Candidatus Woesearchaeota archaeon]